MRTILLFLAMFLSLTGCNKSVAQKDRIEWADEQMAEAQEDARNGRIDAAIKLYTQALKAKPDLAIGHLELGLLLHSYEADYVSAIYHYQQYLEMTPGSEKTEMVTVRIRQASQQFAAMVASQDAPQQTEATQTQKDDLALRKVAEEKMTRARAQTRRLQELLDAERAKSASLAAKLAAVGKPITPTQSGTAKPPPPKPPAEPAVPTVRTYQVLRGDTLSKIALKVYKDPGKWRQIFDANKATLGGSELVRPGQVLVIP